MAKTSSTAATRKDVAKLAGVSPPTVSLVLNNTPGTRISEKTRQRVMDAAKTLKYRPSPIARALVCGKTMTIGIVLHHIRDPFSSFSTPILEGFWLKLEEQGYRLILASGKPDQAIAGLYRDRSVDGIAVMAVYSEAADSELKDALDANFPVVFIGSRPVNFPVNYVDIDNRKAGRWATEQLIAQGHKRIIHLTGPNEVNSSAVDRMEGYKDALKAAGIPIDPKLILFGSYNPKIASESLTKALEKGVKFSAIFAANTAMAQGAVQTLAKRGIKVPEDVSLTAIDRASSDLYTGPEITRVGLPLPEIGCTACDLLMKRVQDNSIAPAEAFLPYDCIDGNSVAPAKK